jgi:phospholipid-binding lipoprotein MlaA
LPNRIALCMDAVLSEGRVLGVSAWTIALLLSGTQTLPKGVPQEQSAEPALPVSNVPQQSPATAPEMIPPPLPPADAPPGDEPDPSSAGSDEIIVNGVNRSTPGDPLEVVNEQSYEVTQALDKAVVGPAASAYKAVLPKPVRSGLRNFFNNLAEPIVFLNYLLQLKPGRGAETVGRFAINSTIGVAGLVDVAKKRPFNLPLRRNGFANTLGYYGVKPGPFLYLPLIGPTTIRDLFGLGLDRLVLPTAVGKPFNQPAYAIPASIIGSLDYRVEYDAELKKVREADNPYAASRARYLKSRQAEIDALKDKRSIEPTTGQSGK